VPSTPSSKPTPPAPHAGLILAAGASARMGRPKALLRLPSGRTLAEDQARRLEEAGCRPVVVVLGADAEGILAELKNLQAVVNPDWERGGRFSSVQAGLRALDLVEGCLILPVDTAGVRTSTLKQILDFADEFGPPAIRPVCNHRRGQLAWISARLKPRLLEQAAGPEARLDELLERLEEDLPVKDPAIGRNINTPQEWKAYLRLGPER
jgi:CTP:molybdopterin cytidylyltransferase MocA